MSLEPDQDPNIVFLSCVSGQFPGFRQAIASDLRVKDYKVIAQEDFIQHGGTLLEKLEKYVGTAGRMIVLVGDAYGSEHDPTALPAGLERRSYTQWEYEFALGRRLNGTQAKRKDNIQVYFATEAYRKANHVEQDEEKTRLQREFVEKIKASGKDYNEFGSLHELRALVLRNDLSIPTPARKANNLPYDSLGTRFKVRDDFLESLKEKLASSDGRAVGVITKKVIHGLGGVGKTRAAVEFAWRNESDYDALLFVNADSPANLDRSLAELTGPSVLDIKRVKEELEEKRKVAAALRWLEEHKRWLLILDNVDTPEAAEHAKRLFPKLINGHVVITSRLKNWPPGVEPIELDVLDTVAARDYLLERTKGSRKLTRTDDSDAYTLAEAVDGLALALEQAGAYIAYGCFSFADYLDRWKAQDLKVLDWYNGQLMDYPRSLATTFDLSFDCLNAEKRRLLRILAWFAPDPIPLSVFESKVLAESVPDARMVLAGLAAYYSLVRLEVGTFTAEVHRLVQEITRLRMTEEERRETLEVALATLNQGFPEDASDVRTWPVLVHLLPHVQAAAAEGDHVGIGHPTSRLMNDAALFLHSSGNSARAEPLFRRALEIDERMPGPDRPEVDLRLNNLALLFYNTNRLTEAEPLYRRALAIDEHWYGPNHPNVARVLDNLASLLRATNRLAQAEPLNRRALAIAEPWYGPEHNITATLLNNLAGLLIHMNRLVEAELLYRRALAVHVHSCGPDHPKVGSALNNIAELMRMTNRRATTDPLYRRALTIVESSYGPDHGEVAIELNNLALSLRFTNRLEEAEPL